VGRNRQDDGRGGILVSRGGAAYLAVAEVAERFGEEGELEIEAVEEPSSIAGHDISELSYTGIEPWVPLLRDLRRRWLQRPHLAPSRRARVALLSRSHPAVVSALPWGGQSTWASLSLTL